jgi:serine phosphatase RsbU (regulator of sigma subunit)
MARPAVPLVTSARRLLLVEDDQGDAVLVRACLEESGVPPEAITWTRTLSDATAALHSQPHCVLLDLGLPDADGLTALTTVVESSPNTAVIVLTGRNDPGGLDALSVGAEDYLVKDDITPELLDRSIRYAIERKRAQRTAQQLREARLSSAEKARLERGLLPTPLLRTGAVECSSYYQPGRDHAVLGGDFFDVVELDNGIVRAVIGDVMGHGPDEAALGVHLRVAWRTLILAGASEEEILPSLARLLAAETAGHPGFVTACDLTIDLVNKTMRMRVAGHPAPLICAEGKTTYLDVQVGPPLGVEAPGAAVAESRKPTWPETHVALAGDASLIMYTDGLLDAYVHLTDDASLGIDELVDAVTTCVAEGGAIGSWIPSLVGAAPNSSLDDTAVVVITVRPDSQR